MQSHSENNQNKPKLETDQFVLCWWRKTKSECSADAADLVQRSLMTTTNILLQQWKVQLNSIKIEKIF